MIISELGIQDLKDYAHVNHTEDDNLFDSILVACKAYIKGYTGLPLIATPTPEIPNPVTVDSYEDLTIALMVLANEMYDNRTFTVENDKVNVVIKSILDMHSINLL